MDPVLDDEHPLGAPHEARRIVADGRGEANGPAARRRLDPDLGAAAEVRVRPDELAVVHERAACLGEREHLGRVSRACPAHARPQATGEPDRRVPRLGGHVGLGGQAPAASALGDRTGVAGSDPSGTSVGTDGASPAPIGRSSQMGATFAFDSIRRVAGGTGNTAVGVPAAAHTTWNRPRSGSMITRTGRAWPMGGIPPIVNPVSSFASFAVARRTSGSPLTAASRATSTRFGPETRHSTGSSVPSSAGATNTSDFTIWPSSAPTARAASSAVWVDSENTCTSSATPLRAAASTTRWIGAATGVSGTAGVYRTRGTIGGMPTGPRLADSGRHVVVVAAGDVPARAALDAAWPAWAEAVDGVIAADAGFVGARA